MIRSIGTRFAYKGPFISRDNDLVYILTLEKQRAAATAAAVAGAYQLVAARLSRLAMKSRVG